MRDEGTLKWKGLWGVGMVWPRERFSRCWYAAAQGKSSVDPDPVGDLFAHIRWVREAVLRPCVSIMCVFSRAEGSCRSSVHVGWFSIHPRGQSTKSKVQCAWPSRGAAVCREGWGGGLGSTVWMVNVGHGDRPCYHNHFHFHYPLPPPPSPHPLSTYLCQQSPPILVRLRLTLSSCTNGPFGLDVMACSYK